MTERRDMLGDLQRQKAGHYFDLIDEDDNGLIEPADFQMRADRLAQVLGVTGDEQEALRHQVMKWWEHLSTLADANDDGQVTRQEWQLYWERFKIAVSLGQTARSIDNLKRVARETFAAIDRTGNGQVTREEFSNWLTAWDVDGHDAVFDRLDRDQTGTLTRDDFTEAVKEFYLSNDPDAPGNVLYGELPNDVQSL